MQEKCLCAKEALAFLPDAQIRVLADVELGEFFITKRFGRFGKCRLTDDLPETIADWDENWRAPEAAYDVEPDSGILTVGAFSPAGIVAVGRCSVITKISASSALKYLITDTSGLETTPIRTRGVNAMGQPRVGGALQQRCDGSVEMRSVYA